MTKNAYFQLEEKENKVYLRIFPEQGEDFVSLCKNADAVLYDIKQNGKATFKMK